MRLAPEKLLASFVKSPFDWCVVTTKYTALVYVKRIFT